MAYIGLFESAIASLCFLIFYCFLNKKPFGFLHLKKPLQSYPWNWPVLGMLPAVLVRFNRIDDAIWIIEKTNLTFLFKGPWFTKMDALITVDPANIHHIFSSNFSNYVKGPEFKEIFDVYGDAIFNTDSELWKNLRMSSQAMLNHQGFQNLSFSITTSKLKNVLLPLLNQISEEGTIVDLQDVFQRFMFDTTLETITGSDPQSLSIEMPEVEFAKAFDNAGEAIVFRHIIPRFLWKLQNWMGLGHEKKMIEAGATFDRMCEEYISAKREEIRSKGSDHDQSNVHGEDLLTSHIKLDTSKYELLKPSDNKFLRDSILTFVFAGRDSTSTALTWFFWLISKNPHVEAKIHQEINANLPKLGGCQERPWSSAIDSKEYLNKLVYLHGALCEAMRLYPPVPFQRKSPIKSDVLPSGHRIDANSNIIIPLYALGRMRSVWGEDALEFKPERWVSETGGLRHEPSSKFLAFNAGPRTCPGKHLAMTVMKTVVVEMLQNYDIKVVKGHKIEPKPRLVLHMKNGLRSLFAFHLNFSMADSRKMCEEDKADDETIPETQFVDGSETFVTPEKLDDSNTKKRDETTLETQFDDSDSDDDSEDDSNKKNKEEETPKEYTCCFESSDSDLTNLRTIFVQGFDCSFPLDEIKSTLKDAFSTCGKVSSVYIPYHCKSGSPLGFAFINMVRDEEEALKLDGTRLGERTLEVTMARRRSE
ncbi:unnamed protein product [Thlaspi arvense]|uniref:RRM domain-containing protein n=1 Tax=Thlaspi arvense TaxID=13288 RepID=A0AAU9SXM5_THLAR|nr:unnamed protein product [Thlaspi arvense]